MKTTNTILIIVGVIIILGIVYLIWNSNKKEAIKHAAINSGIPPKIATDVANSTNPQRSLRSLGVPSDVATLISLGTSVQTSNTEIYKCSWTDPKTGAVTTKSGPCTQVDANNGWVTSSI